MAMTVSSFFRLPVRGTHLEYSELGDLRKLFINLTPQLPENDGCELDLRRSEAEKWVRAHHENCRDSLNVLVDQIVHVSFQTFLKSLGRSIQDIKCRASFEDFKDSGKEKISNSERKFIVLVEGGKSNQWVAELARRYFKFIPSDYYRLGDKEAKVFAYEADQHSAVLENDLVLFDDASYSGKQISDHLLTILNLLGKTQSKARVFIIVPFMTASAQESIDNVLLLHKKLRSRVFVAEHEMMKSVKNVLTPEQFGELKHHYTDLTGKETVTYFSHKMPNSMSFFSGISNGTIRNNNGCVDRTKYELVKKINSLYK